MDRLKDHSLLVEDQNGFSNKYYKKQNVNKKKPLYGL